MSAEPWDPFEDEPPLPPSRSLTGGVLLVEDNDLVATTIQMMLEGMGLSVRHVGSAQAALAVIDQGSPVDLVVSDIAMPGMNGMMLARELRRRMPDLPVILATGYAPAASEAGREGFLVLNKPYAIESLERLIFTVLKKSGPASGEKARSGEK